MQKHRKYVLVSSVCSEQEYDAIHTDDAYKTSQSIIRFGRLFCQGFVANGKTVEAYSARPTDKKRCGRTILPAKTETVDGVRYHYTTGVYIRRLKHLYTLIRAFLQFMKRSTCTKNDVVIYDPLVLSWSMGAVAACRLRGITTVALITDVPICYAYNRGSISTHQQQAYRLGTKADAFIFLTEKMNELMNPKGRPYIVMEALADETMQHRTVTDDERYAHPVVMYAGGVEEMYGLDMLVEGFVKADVPNAELHIYGAGRYVDQLKEWAKQYPQIQYKGCKSNAAVVAEQTKVTLLVNPRYTDAEYTQYSFPGKNVEYMTSGTPVLFTKLPGMPTDYYPYVYLLEEENADGMATALRDILTTDRQTLAAFGAKAKEWVLENKVARVQVGRCLTFFDQLLKD